MTSETAAPAPSNTFRDLALAGPLATDGSLVFAALSTGPVLALDPGTGPERWVRAGLKPGFVVARPGLLVFVEKGGVAWGIRAEDGSAAWKTTTGVSDVSSVRLDGNRVFFGGASGLAALMVSTGESRFELDVSKVRDIDVAGDWLASIEDGG